MRKIYPAVLALTLCFGLLFAACGDKRDEDKTTTTTTESTTSSTTNLSQAIDEATSEFSDLTSDADERTENGTTDPDATATLPESTSATTR